MEERWTKLSGDAEKNQEKQFNIWHSGNNISFISSEAEEEYKRRITLIKDSIQLEKTPERVPICPATGSFPLEYAGITMHNAMYDYNLISGAWEKYCRDFIPDTYNAPTTIVPGRVFDVLDYTQYKWPGHGLPEDSSYQFIEMEYMKAEEYQELIDDPTGFFLRFFFPRAFGSLTPLGKSPLIPTANEMPLVTPVVMPFGTPDLQESLEKLKTAGEEALKWFNVVGKINGRLMGHGYPLISSGMTKAPLDVIGDSLRGTKGVIMDMYRYPDELIEACERITPFMIKAGVGTCKATGHIMTYIPLHKGADGFMSEEQFITFYWPTLRKLIIGLIENGIVPLLFAEGGYNSRLDIISDIPKGKVVWLFENTDMARAKETVGRVACIMGNVPLSLLSTGTPDDVKEYCKKLVDIAGKDGGFILSTSAGMADTRPENVKAMIDFTREYAIYS